MCTKTDQSKVLDPQNALDNNDNSSEEQMGNIPSFNPKMKLKETPCAHKYATQPKRQTHILVQSTKLVCKQTLVD